MSRPEEMKPEEQQELIAYLDGELEGRKARAVEAKLSNNPAVRREVEVLKRTWEMLDFLPRPPAPDHFAHKTAERLEVERRTVAMRVRRQRWFGKALLASGIASAGIAGFVGFYQRPPSSGDARVLQYLRYYERVDDLEFLNELAQPELFGEDA